MEIDAPAEVSIHRESDIFNARILGKRLAALIGFSDIEMAEIEIVISELGTNIIKHAGGEGLLSFRPIREDEARGIEIISRDQGPGMALKEPKEKAGGARKPPSLGIGLSGIRRLMDECEIESRADGTLIRTRKWLVCSRPDPFRCSVMARPRLGEALSGDDFFIKKLPKSLLFGLIDALGHGPEASAVAKNAVRVLEENHRRSLDELVKMCHQELKGGRGAAMALGRIDLKDQCFDHIAVGNVETRVFGSGSPLRPSCANGTLGMVIEGVKSDRYPFSEGDCIIMFTDGISGRFDLDNERLKKSPQEIAGHILDRYGRTHDDATVMVIC